MTDCQDCAAAEVKVWSAFIAGCKGCQARAIARSPQCYAAAKAGRQTAAYRELLQRFEVTHAQVLEAAQRDYQTRRRAA